LTRLSATLASTVPVFAEVRILQNDSCQPGGQVNIRLLEGSRARSRSPEMFTGKSVSAIDL
jgi:hypothetical protein